jgi:hypothetical protein
MSSWKAAQAALLDDVQILQDSGEHNCEGPGLRKRSQRLKGIPLVREPLRQFSWTQILISISQ